MRKSTSNSFAFGSHCRRGARARGRSAASGYFGDSARSTTSSRKQGDIHGIRPKWRIHPKDVHLYRRAEDRHVGVSLKPLPNCCDRHFGRATRLPSSVFPRLSCDAKAYNVCMKHFSITAARWP